MKADDFGPVLEAHSTFMKRLADLSPSAASSQLTATMTELTTSIMALDRSVARLAAAVEAVKDRLLPT